MATTSLLLSRSLISDNVDKIYTYLSPDIEYCHDHHLPYFIVAVLCTLVIVIGIPLLLLLEPFLNHKINEAISRSISRMLQRRVSLLCSLLCDLSHSGHCDDFLTVQTISMINFTDCCEWDIGIDTTNSETIFSMFLMVLFYMQWPWLHWHHLSTIIISILCYQLLKF